MGSTFGEVLLLIALEMPVRIVRRAVTYQVYRAGYIRISYSYLPKCKSDSSKVEYYSTKSVYRKIKGIIGTRPLTLQYGIILALSEQTIKLSVYEYAIC